MHGCNLRCCYLGNYRQTLFWLVLATPTCTQQSELCTLLPSWRITSDQMLESVKGSKDLLFYHTHTACSTSGPEPNKRSIIMVACHKENSNDSRILIVQFQNGNWSLSVQGGSPSCSKLKKKNVALLETKIQLQYLMISHAPCTNQNSDYYVNLLVQTSRFLLHCTKWQR